MTAGEVYWVDLPESDGREQAGRRPAIVLQDDTYAGMLPVVLVAPLTSSLKTLRFPGTVRVDPTPANGLQQPSVVLGFQLRAVDRYRIERRLGTLSADDLLALFGVLDRLMGRAA